jgi:tetratricopeptide (TPR) repeat protein
MSLNPVDDESISTLMARREYDRAVPLLKRDLDKYPSNVRIRLQYADALSGAGRYEEALEQYEHTSRFYEENGLIVQAIAVRKKLERIGALIAEATAAETPAKAARVAPESPLFEDMTPEEREATVERMVLETFEMGDIIITEGEQGSSLYVIVSGEVKVYTRGTKGESFYLATLGAGDFFGEVSVLTGKPRTATITASTRSELLRLDKEQLDRVVETHPRVREILDQFYRRRAAQTVEAMIDSLKTKKGS